MPPGHGGQTTADPPGALLRACDAVARPPSGNDGSRQAWFSIDSRTSTTEFPKGCRTSVL